MRKFKLEATVTISIYTEVEANNLEDAIEIARERDIEKSHWGDKDQSKYAWVNDEYDGEPQDIKET